MILSLMDIIYYVHILIVVDNKKKKARRPTCMPQLWGLKKQLDVSFNDFGQPNDQKSTSTLAHFLGTIARNGLFCPLNYKDWRLMPSSYKEDMLKEVKVADFNAFELFIRMYT